MMKRIAIPMADNDLCDHFERFQYFLIYDLDNPSGIREDMKFPPNTEIERIPEWLNENGVTDIIARGIDHKSIKSLNQNKIHVFVGVKKKNPEDLIRDYFKKLLDTDETMCY